LIRCALQTSFCTVFKVTSAPSSKSPSAIMAKGRH
jgi:hypothetical protein